MLNEDGEGQMVLAVTFQGEEMVILNFLIMNLRYGIERLKVYWKTSSTANSNITITGF